MPKTLNEERWVYAEGLFLRRVQQKDTSRTTRELPINGAIDILERRESGPDKPGLATAHLAPSQQPTGGSPINETQQPPKKSAVLLHLQDYIHYSAAQTGGNHLT